MLRKSDAAKLRVTFYKVCHPLITVPMPPVAVILACCATPSPKFRVEKAVSPSGIITLPGPAPGSGTSGYDACRHQVACREEAVLQVGSHRLLAGRDSRQVLHLYAEHDVEQQ